MAFLWASLGLPPYPLQPLQAAEDKLNSPRYDSGAHHLFGMLLAERGLVSDVEHRDGALLAVSKLGGAAGEELLRVVQQDVLGDPLRKYCNVPAMSQ